MTFNAIDAWWWPYVFILIAGWLATDSWRFLGVYLGGRISEDSEILVLVRCIATALVAAVVAGLVLRPSGALADSSIWLRAGAAVTGFAAYIVSGNRMIAGIIGAELVLGIGIAFGA